MCTHGRSNGHVAYASSMLENKMLFKKENFSFIYGIPCFIRHKCTIILFRETRRRLENTTVYLLISTQNLVTVATVSIFMCRTNIGL
jgi:hypothetical protein